MAALGVYGFTCSFLGWTWWLYSVLMVLPVVSSGGLSGCTRVYGFICSFLGWTQWLYSMLMVLPVVSSGGLGDCTRCRSGRSGSSRRPVRRAGCRCRQGADPLSSAPPRTCSARSCPSKQKQKKFSFIRKTYTKLLP